jgi:low affinity Fe/Cu permease
MELDLGSIEFLATMSRTDRIKEPTGCGSATMTRQNGRPATNHKAADPFRALASKASYAVGTKWAFLLAILLIIAWAVTGPFFHYSDTWQLVVNTATTIVTFLIVFLIQNTQNRDARAIHLKLDEIIRSISHAHNEMIDIENLSDQELEKMASVYERIRREYEFRGSKGRREPKVDAPMEHKTGG